MQDIINFLRTDGFPVSEFIPDGKVHRFEIDRGDRQAGFYVGHRNFLLRTGEEWYFVQYGSWRSGETKDFSTLKGIMTQEDRDNLEKQVKKNQRAIEKIKSEGQLEACSEVEERWEKLDETGESEYLKEKGIPGIGIKYDSFNQAIYVPLRDSHGKLWSLQKIDRDGKRFHPGGRVKGCFHSFGDPKEKIYLAEGFATATSIYLATSEFTVCALSAGNLTDTAKALKSLYPEKTFILCGDDDEAGHKHSEAAAKVCLGTAIFPSGANDWNDLHQLAGLDEVKRQLETRKIEKQAVHALGFKEGEYFFTSSQNKQVVALSSFSEKDFLHLMTLDYWEALFPGKTEKSRVDWTAARSNLMDTARKRGIFQSNDVRGAGVWTDDGRIVVNMGDHLIVDGEKTELNGVKSRYFYTLGKKLPPLPINPLSKNECGTLISTCCKFKWANQDSGILLAGALILSRVCGALPVRPHVWVTGGALTGKTTIVEKLISVILGESKLYVQSNTTEAAVRQILKADAMPVLFDEFETTGRRSDENVASLIELMRASWSDSGALIAKGGATGNASFYQTRFSAIVSSIRTKLINDADRGRFAVLELAPHGSDQSHWQDLSVLLAEIDNVYSERLFARTVKMLPVLLKNYRLIKKLLAQKIDSRFGDQYGMLLAGYSVLAFDGEIDESDANFLTNVQVDLGEEQETAKNSDHDDAFTHLLSTKITFDAGMSRKDALIGDLIEYAKNNPHSETEKNALRMLGMRVEDKVLAVACGNHAELESKVWRGTRWSQTWGNSLRRLPGAEKKKMRFADKTYWVIKIPGI